MGANSISRSAAVVKRVQYAALPYRLMGRSRTEVMLVTSLRYAALDHPQGLAAERPGTPPFRRARSVRRGRRRGGHRQPPGRNVSLPKAPQERRRRRLRSGGLRAPGAATEQAVAGKRRAPGQVGIRAGSGRNGTGAQAEHDHPPLGAEVGRLRQALAARAFAHPTATRNKALSLQRELARTRRAAAAIDAAATGRDRRRCAPPPADARRGRAPGDDGDRSRASHPARRARA